MRFNVSFVTWGEGFSDLSRDPSSLSPFGKTRKSECLFLGFGPLRMASVDKERCPKGGLEFAPVSQPFRSRLIKLRHQQLACICQSGCWRIVDPQNWWLGRGFLLKTLPTRLTRADAVSRFRQSQKQPAVQSWVWDFSNWLKAERRFPRAWGHESLEFGDRGSPMARRGPKSIWKSLELGSDNSLAASKTVGFKMLGSKWSA